MLPRLDGGSLAHAMLVCQEWRWLAAAAAACQAALKAAEKEWQEENEALQQRRRWHLEHLERYAASWDSDYEPYRFSGSGYGSF